MILRGADANRYLAKPDPARPGLLIFGADAMRVALKRQDAILALAGPDAEAEMRLSRIAAGDLRRDGSLLADAIKEVGFFPGPRVAFAEDATDGLAPAIATALEAWKPGDATIVVTAGELKGKSALKTLFEKHPAAVCIGFYDEPPSREEIEAELKKAGLTQISPEALADLHTLGRALDPGDFRQTLQKLALYKWQDATPLQPAEVTALAPSSIEAETDDLTHAVAERSAAAVGGLMRRLEGQGVGAVEICIAATRHFRALHTAKADPGGLAKARVFGTRRDRMQRQLGQWQLRALEQALATLVQTDLTLRSASRAPGHALIERALIRIAMTRG
ncbi:DNA polymerase III subunit delta [Neotabrizicola sp. sgz301269]|uniref:DNA polymerase III subunit delta n=1 Tax=Neotabrizicola sp. sgz301269 TaxID=3276282 RepID=UPI0037703ACE